MLKVLEVKKNASTIAANIDSTNLSDLLESISDNSDVFIEIMNIKGGNVYLYGTAKDYLPPAEKMRLVNNAEAQNGEYYEYITPRPPDKPVRDEFIGDFKPENRQPLQSLVYVKFVHSSTKGTPVLFMNTVISPVNATVTTLRYQLYVITGIMLILAVLLALIIAKRVSRPIEEINKSAKALARGDYDAHFTGKGFLEIGELSDTLNSAAVELSKAESLRRELIIS